MSLLRISTQAGDLEMPDNADEQFFITRQIHDLNSWETRNADFTSTLTVAATPNNIAILNVASSVGGSAENVDNKIQCSIYLNGITVAPVAFMLSTRRILLQNSTTFEVVIFYGNFNLFDTISGDDISELNWADLAIDWQPSDLQAVANNTTDLVYPICDWHTRNSKPIVYIPYNNTITIEINTTGFFIYAKEIIKRIINEAGFELIIDSSVPDDYNLIALACPVTKFIDLQEGSSILSTTVKSSPAQTIVGTTENATYQTTNNDPGNIFDHTNNEWLIQSPDDYYFEAKGSYSYDHPHPQNDPSRIVLYHNLTELASISFDADVTNQEFFMSTNVSAIATDILYVVMEASNNRQDATLTMLTGGSTTISTPGAAPDRNVQPSQHIPQIDQGSFISNMLKLFNLLLLTNDIESTVTLMSFDVLYTNKENDLSAALATGEAVVETDNYLGSLGQNSHMRWQEDNLLRRNANYVANFPSQILNKTVDVITMDFSACDNSQLLFNNANDTFLKAKIPMSEITRTVTGGLGDARITVDAAGEFIITGVAVAFEIGDWFRLIEDSIGNNDYYRVIRKDSETAGAVQSPIDFNNINTSDLYEVISAESNDFVARLAIVRFDDGLPDSISIMQGTTEALIGFPADGLSAHWMDSLKMSEIAESHYKRVFDSLQTPQVIRARFNLRAIDVLNFDFTRPVYVDAFNAFYYVNKINKFKLNSTTELELVRISALVEDAVPATQGQFNNDFNNDFKINQ